MDNLASMELSNDALLALLGLLVGFWLGLYIDIKQHQREIAFKRERIARKQFNKSTLPLRSVLWRQIWQLNLFIPLPDDSILDEIAELLDEDDRDGFYEALAQFKKSRAIGPTSGDYGEVSYSDENVARIRKWADVLLGYL